jgi:hypothetical protein
MLRGSRPPRIPLWFATRIDDEAVEYHRSVGCFTPAEEREPLTVDLVQRDDLSPDGEPASVQRNPAQVRVSGIRLSSDEARQLARLLNAAATLINNAAQQNEPPNLPRRNWGGGWNGGYGLAPRRPASSMPAQKRSA